MGLTEPPAGTEAEAPALEVAGDTQAMDIDKLTSKRFGY